MFKDRIPQYSEGIDPTRFYSPRTGSVRFGRGRMGGTTNNDGMEMGTENSQGRRWVGNGQAKQGRSNGRTNDSFTSSRHTAQPVNGGPMGDTEGVGRKRVGRRVGMM